MASTQCAIWGTPAEMLEKTGDFAVIDSQRAGGQYLVTGSAVAELGPLTKTARKLLTTWLCEQRRLGVGVPRIQSGVVELLKTRRPLVVTARLTATLRAFGRRIDSLGQQLTLGESNDADTHFFFAETETDDVSELRQLLRMLIDMGYLEGQQFVSGSTRARPTASGWSEIEKLNQAHSVSSQAFVAMWFNESTNDAYQTGIAPAIAAVGYDPIRIDKKEHNNKIDDEIIAEIRRSRFLVADFTCEPKNARGGVYYEAGFAQGIGIPVIWTCKDTSINDLHFDTRQYAHIVWTTPDDLYVQLKSRIGATLGDGPLPKKEKP